MRLKTNTKFMAVMKMENVFTKKLYSKLKNHLHVFVDFSVLLTLENISVKLNRISKDNHSRTMLIVCIIIIEIINLLAYA